MKTPQPKTKQNKNKKDRPMSQSIDNQTKYKIKKNNTKMEEKQQNILLCKTAVRQL